MLPQTRQRLKHALGWTQIKLVYARITLTRFTTVYFILSLLSCIALVILQGVAYADNSKAVRIIGALLSETNVPKGLPIFSNGILQICDSLPGQPGATCTVVPLSKGNRNEVLTSRDDRGEIGLSKFIAKTTQHKYLKLWARIVEEGKFKGISAAAAKEDDDSESDFSGDSSNDDLEESDLSDDEENGSGDNKREKDPNNSPGKGSSDKASPGNGDRNTNGTADFATIAIRNIPCAQTMVWLEDVLEDEKREDVVTIFFNFWLFSLAFVTVLNESLPHLGASLAGHVLATGWSVFRVISAEKLRHNYEKLVVNGACGVDFMEEWWGLRKNHIIPILVICTITLLAIAWLSFMLFKVYASQSFSRVGASPQVNRIYKIVLVFSASLQLTAFFSLASTAMWIDHICYGIAQAVARHRGLYLAAFIVTLLLLLPWLVLGWVSVRKEGRKRFLLFSIMSVFLVAVSAMMFASALYRFIFTTWRFFATITVTAFVLIVATSLLGVWCRLNFGKGLAHFLQVSSALDDVDFTPVNFLRDPEKGSNFQFGFTESSEKYPADLMTGYIQQPKLSYSKGHRGQSVYSEANGIPVKLSSTPSLFQEGITKGSSTRRQRRFGGESLQLGSDGYTQPQVPLRTASPRSRESTRSGYLGSPSRSSVAGSTTSSLPKQSATVTPIVRQGLPTNPKLRSSDV